MNQRTESRSARRSGAHPPSGVTTAGHGGAALIHQLSTRLINAPIDELNDDIAVAVDGIRRWLGLPTLELYTRTPDGHSLHRLPSRSRRRGARGDVLPRHWPIRHVPWLCDRMKRGVPCFLGDPFHLPAEAATERGELLVRGIRRAAAVPLHFEGDWRGLLIAVGSSTASEWSDTEQRFLTQAGRLLAWSLQRRDQAPRLQRQREVDDLTGLPGRTRHFRHLVEAQPDRQRPLAVLLIDIEETGALNERLGHTAVNRLLRVIGDRLRARVGADGMVSRWGADEFLVTLPLDGVGQAEALARQLQALVAEPIDIEEGALIELRTTIGIAHGGVCAASVADLVRFAELALRQATKRRRGGIESYGRRLHRDLKRTACIRQSLRRALDHDGFRLDYQPQICAQSGRIVGVEALIRLDDPQHGTLSPAEFIPVAERAGLVHDIGHWVVEHACAEVARWPAGPHGPIRLALNVSVHQLRDRSLPGTVAQAIARHGLVTEQVELEITESGLMESPQRAAECLSRCRELGLRVAADDFGTGYSSLSLLQQLPVDTLKIDRCFVDGMLKRRNDRAIVIAILALARSLELNVVAEGVESAEQAAALIEHGCTRMQGYHFSRPVPGDKAQALWRRGRVD